MSKCTYNGFTNSYAIGAFIANLTHRLAMLDYDRSIFDEARDGKVFSEEVLLQAEKMADELNSMSHIGENNFSHDLNELKQFLLNSIPI
jgi:hypothetical protein